MVCSAIITVTGMVIVILALFTLFLFIDMIAKIYDTRAFKKSEEALEKCLRDRNACDTAVKEIKDSAIAGVYEFYEKRVVYPLRFVLFALLLSIVIWIIKSLKRSGRSLWSRNYILSRRAKRALMVLFVVASVEFIAEVLPICFEPLVSRYYVSNIETCKETEDLCRTKLVQTQTDYASSRQRYTNTSRLSIVVLIILMLVFVAIYIWRPYIRSNMT